MPHTDGSKMSRRFLKIRPQSSSPEKNIIQDVLALWRCNQSGDCALVHMVTVPLQLIFKWTEVFMRLFGRPLHCLRPN